ncbi:MAG: GNAT family N-acetyltransferase [Parasphingorhabdus sp.]|uniref:GNAT family N-acetyltransferase n=1 Tax=Parasphingorhabdus sp. TaxID=2709688 RepID=UPI00329805FB
MNAPELNTERLLLRALDNGDYPVYRDFYADPDASAAYGGPLEPGLAWRRLALDIGHWALRGYGMWAVIDRKTNLMVGGCGLFWPEEYPRSELTWWIVPAARRKGIALEASKAVINFGYDVLKWELVETHMNDDNSAARKLAEKLGGTIIAREEFPDGLSRNIYALPHQSGDE